MSQQPGAGSVVKRPSRLTTPSLASGEVLSDTAAGARPIRRSPPNGIQASSDQQPRIKNETVARGHPAVGDRCAGDSLDCSSGMAE